MKANRILMINKFLYPNGGSENYIIKLGAYLKSQHHEVQYFGMDHPDRCLGNAVNAYTTGMDFHGGSKLSKLAYPIKTIYNAEARKKLCLVLNDFKPDVCHINNFNYQLTPAILLEIVKWRKVSGRKCQILMTAHDYQLVCPNHMLYNPNTQENCEKCFGNRFFNCLKGKCIHGSALKSLIGTAEAMFWNLRGTYKYIDTIICCSKFLKQKMDQNPLFAKKTVVLHNFIDRAEWKDQEKKDYVLYFGRYSKEKGIEKLIQACQELPDIPFVFAGTGPLEQQLQGIKNIKNVGFQTGEALERLVREARFSLCPSACYENCPFSVMESQIYGTPVLGADAGGIPELIAVGKTGELFTSGNQAELKAKIVKLWTHRELTGVYAKNCKDITFPTLKDYYQKLIHLYTEQRQKVKKGQKKLNGTVIVTYRCNAKCNMCSRYKVPSKAEEEITVDMIRRLPKMYFTNITGGEPFIREDLKEIVRELYKKSDRIVISTNGFFTDRIEDLCREFPQIGIRISIEGRKETNDEIRGLPNGYERGYETLRKLVQMGMKDVGFGMTVQDRNARDLVPLYKISKEMRMEFATASLHNSFYFVESGNIIHDRPLVAENFEHLINELLLDRSPKKWFRAYFNHGLINYIYGEKRLLPCNMSFDTFFVDPYGDVMPCNGTKDKEVMGNLNRQSWDALWNSRQADEVRKKVRECGRNCWMIGSVSPAMHKYIWVPVWWIITHKLKFWTKKKYSMYENKIVRDYRDGRVTKEELDGRSTCDITTGVQDGLLRFSVILPVYNVEAYLNRCIKSIVNQTYSNLELILVDDGAKDNCPQICDEWQKKDARIKVIHKKNEGLGEARNSGLKLAKGDYICFFDSDDYVRKTLLEDAYQAILEQRPDLVEFGYYRVNESGSVYKKHVPDLPQTWYEGSAVMDQFLPEFICANYRTGKASNLMMSAWCGIFKAKVLKESEFSFVSERELISEDIYSIMRLMPQVKSVCILKEAYYYYCQNKKSLSNTYLPERFERIIFFQECLERLCGDECYSDEVRERIYKPFLDHLIACIKMEVQCKKARGSKKTHQRIKEILSHEMVQKALHMIPDVCISKPRKLLHNCMRSQNAWGVIALVWMKNHER